MKKNEKVVPKWLVSLPVSTFQTQLPMGCRFPNIESEQSVWSEQPTALLQDYTDPLH